MASAATGTLLVTRNLPPLVGGMENVNLQLARALAARGPLSVCGPEGSATVLPTTARVIEAPLRPLARFMAAALAGTARLARERRPGLVMAGSGLTLPLAWVGAKLSGARVCAYLHGLDVIADHPVYRAIWPRFIRQCDFVFANSRYTAGLVERQGLPADRIHVLNPGADLPDLQPDARRRFRTRHGLGQDAPLLLSVGRLTRRKGLAEFVTDVLPSVVATRPGARLLVIGGEASDALTGGGGERARIEAAARDAGISASVVFLGRLDEAQLAEAYQAVDLHVFPVRELPGDVEGFGMVALEAAAHGLRTVAYSVGGVPDAVRVPDSGCLVPSGDHSRFSSEVIELLGTPAPGVESAREFASTRTWQAFAIRLNELLDRHVAW